MNGELISVKQHYLNQCLDIYSMELIYDAEDARLTLFFSLQTIASSGFMRITAVYFEVDLFPFCLMIIIKQE